MKRPTERPAKPMTFEEIVEKCHTHFVKESQPQCSQGIVCRYNSSGAPPCLPELTTVPPDSGCFVGFMLTTEDATTLDLIGGRIGQLLKKPRVQEILLAYFEDSPEVWTFLAMGQASHDRILPEHWTNFIHSLLDYVSDLPGMKGTP